MTLSSVIAEATDESALLPSPLLPSSSKPRSRLLPRVGGGSVRDIGKDPSRLVQQIQVHL